ncbi:MAG: prefoldin subunit alpha [Candidatus Methanomethylophilaceae archaeon]|nr:prefoldin subunit alpha [Candidatus Methanomethylophilaceae archaeon]
MKLNDSELRQAMALLENYKARMDALSRQVQILRVSLQEVNLALDTLKVFKDAQEGEEIAVPIGATSYINVKVSSNKNVIVDVGSGISLEKTPEQSIEYMEANNAEISEALKKTVESLTEIQNVASQLSSAIQQEYQARQQPEVQ